MLELTKFIQSHKIKKMRPFFITLAALAIVDCGIYVDRIEIDSDPKMAHVLFTSVDDANGDCVVNGTFQLFKKVAKIVLYMKFKIAEDPEDKELKRVLLSTVCDAEKMFSGMQGNVLLRAFADRIQKSLDFELKPPFEPVSLSIFQIYRRESLTSCCYFLTTESLQIYQRDIQQQIKILGT